jgi:hypothetical protein
MEAREAGSKVESSASSPVIYPNHSRGPVVVPVGTRTGDSRIRISLSNLGGPIKVPGLVNPANGTKILNRFPHQSNTVLIILIQNCNPMLRAYRSLNLPKQQQLVTPFYGMMEGGVSFPLNNKNYLYNNKLTQRPICLY